MSKIHYFQRYSSVENTVTNNTLQLMARINEYSVDKLNGFLRELGILVEAGIEIQQQTRGTNSIPDGIILQRSFKILIESKVKSPVVVQQLVNHCGAFADETTKILILLTIDPVPKNVRDQVNKAIKEKYSSVEFKNITYSEMCEALDGFFQTFEDTIFNIAEDYIEYCSDQELTNNSEFLMRIVPTGKSLELNKKYALYFDPSDKGYTPHTFIGFYKEKAVRAIIRIRSVFDVQLKNGRPKKELVFGEETTDFDRRIVDAIADAKTDCGYEIASWHRFFCGDNVFETNYGKTSRGGILGKRFLDLRKLGVKDFNDTEAIARLMKTQTWT